MTNVLKYPCQDHCMTSFIESCADKAADLLQDVQSATDAFQKNSGIRCRSGCGQCCLKPGVEAQVVELLPLARQLLSEGSAAYWHSQAKKTPAGRCVFYAPNPKDETLGRCGRYSLRPSLCRLFGFAAVSGKDGKPPRLAACHWHKELQGNTVTAAQSQIDQGAEVPLFSDYSLRFSLIAPGSGLGDRLPINRALAEAIERLSFLGS